MHYPHYPLPGQASQRSYSRVKHARVRQRALLRSTSSRSAAVEEVDDDRVDVARRSTCCVGAGTGYSTIKLSWLKRGGGRGMWGTHTNTVFTLRCVDDIYTSVGRGRDFRKLPASTRRSSLNYPHAYGAAYLLVCILRLRSQLGGWLLHWR